MAPEDRAVIITHEPVWLISYFHSGTGHAPDPMREQPPMKQSPNLRQLLAGPLKGEQL